MKVGVYFPNLEDISGGAGTFENEIFKALLNKLPTESHHEFVIISDGNKHETLSEGLFKKNIKYLQVKTPRKKTKIDYFIQKIKAKLNLSTIAIDPDSFQGIIQNENVDMVWFTTPQHYDCDIPYIATVWDIQHRLQPWYPEVSQNGQWDFRENFYTKFLQRAAYIITPNSVGRDELSLFYQIPYNRFRLLPHPTPSIEHIPTAGEISETLSKFGLQKGYLFYPAQLWPHKNHATLFMALSILKEKYGQSQQLVLAGGDQGNQEYLKGLAQKLRISDQVHMLGFVSREDLLALYCGASVLTYVSMFGPENLPPLEAFKCGCPVIISDYAGAREQLFDAALFVDGVNSESIAKAINELEKSTKLRMDLIEKGHRMADRYRGEQYINDVFAIIDEFEPVRYMWGNAQSRFY